jgi:OFA family oxalate/formate antiporter-like MFS transporter
VAAFFIKSPPQGYMPEGWTPPAPKGGLIHQNFSPKEMLKTSQFYFITFGLMLACVSGLMVINFASQIAADRGVDKNLIFWAVVVISICNAAGRLFWGTVSDKIGRKNTVMTLLAFTVILILSIAFFEKGGFIIVLIGALGFLYGGFLGTFPAITADYFGTKNAGMNYGIVLLGFGIGAVFAANVGGFFRDQAFKAVNGVTHPEKMIPAFVIGAVCAVIGLVIMFFLKPPKEKAEK